MTTAPSTDAGLLARVRAERVTRDDADRAILRLAVEWAQAHPASLEVGPTSDPDTTDPDTTHADCSDPLDPIADFASEEELEWHGVPEVRWDAFASFAAANQMSTGAGKALIRDALVLSRRLPLVWARVVTGEVQAWRARRIAQAVLGRPDDVVAYVDLTVAARAQEIGLVGLDRVLDEAMLRLYPEERELAQLEELDRRYARLERDTINHTGIVQFVARGDWADLAAFDEAVSAVAAALGAHGCEESLDVRRSMALGVLADPARAVALLEDRPAPAPRRTIGLNVHLSEHNLLGFDPVTSDADGRALLDQAVRAWCGRDDVKLSVRPIRHCGGCPQCPTSGSPHEHGEHALTDYRPSASDRETVNGRDPTCVFPFCSRPARACDCDHIIAFDRGGATCPCNLAPLCRRHHRLKTHAGWHYTIVEPGVYLWSDPYRHQYVRSRDGTHDMAVQKELVT